MLQRMENYIKNVFETIEAEYPDLKIYCWDVVNKSILSDEVDGYRPPATVAGTSGSLWAATIGNDYIEYAFEYARKYAPKGTLLAYNDYNECEAVKSEYIYKLVKKIKEQGNIDVVGMQAHYDMSNPSVSVFENTIRTYASLGLQVQIMELDVKQISNSADDLKKQGYRYKKLFDVLKKLKNEVIDIGAAVVWGITDTTSWIGGYLLLFDDDYKAKPVFHGVAGTDELGVEMKETRTEENEYGRMNLSEVFKHAGTIDIEKDGTSIAQIQTAWDKIAFM